MGENATIFVGYLFFLFAAIGIRASNHEAPEPTRETVSSVSAVQLASAPSERERNLSQLLSQATSSGKAQLRLGTQMHVVKWSGGECYIPEEFYSIVERARSGVLNSLNSQDSVALRAYVEDYFEALKAVMPAPVQISQTIRGIPKPQADTVLARIGSLLREIDQLNPLAIDLDVSSDPHGADFVIEVGQNTQTIRSLNTNDRMQGVWRGLYTATIKMNGYKSREFPLDLVDDSRGKLVCRLIPTNKTGDSSCTRQDQ